MASVLITGTSKGIGLEAALSFGRAGYKVHATMRNPAQAPQLAETAAREKLPIHVSAMDVDSDQSVTDGIARINKDHGPVDVLVNNAGVEKVGSVGRTARCRISGQSWKPTTSERSAAFRPCCPPCGNGAAGALSM